MTACELIRDRLDDWLDDALDAHAEAAVAAHLAECADCARWFELHQRVECDLLHLGATAGRIADSAAPPVISRFRASLRAARWAAGIALATAVAWSARTWWLPHAPPSLPITEAPRQPHPAEPSPPPARIELADADGKPRWAVPLASSNPRITVIWTYATLTETDDSSAAHPQRMGEPTIKGD